MRIHFFSTIPVYLILSACSNPENNTSGVTTASPQSITQEQVTTSVPAGTRTTKRTSTPAPKILRKPQLFLNSGAQPRSNVQTGPSIVADGDDVSLNFVNAPIPDVVRSVLGETLRLTYALDPRVRGNVTLQTSSPIDRADVLPVLENALGLSNVALVRRAGILNVVPANSGASRNQQGIRAASLDAAGFTIRLIPLKFIAAKEIQQILASLVPAGTVLNTVPSRNILVAAGSRQELENLDQLVGLFDVNALANKSFALLPVDNVDASTMASELETVFSVEKEKASDQVKFMVINRLNSILAISASSEIIQQAATWVDRLDRSVESADRRVFVYFLQNGRAPDIAKTLNSLYKAANSRSGVARKITNRAVRAVPPPIPRATQPESAGGQQNGSEFSSDRPKIIADEKNNALLILTTAREYAALRSTLTKIDVPPLQVLIEATIAEVTLTNELRYGVQWFFRDGKTSVALSTGASSAVVPTFPGFSVFTSATNIRTVLSALESVTRVNVLSSPQLMVQNNQTATLQVGDQVPVATQSATSVLTPDAPIVNTIQFKDTGVILVVSPRVNEGGLVTLEITQEVSDVTQTTTSGIDSPTIQQRKINSTVSVQTGETIALGGLIRDRVSRNNSGVPILKDIPVLGELFKNTIDTGTKTELVILLTPRVVRTRRDIRAITKEFKKRLEVLTQ